MNYLAQGMESKEKIKLLFTMTKITRENLQGALIDHFCRDFCLSDAAALNGVKRPNLNPAIEKLNKVAEFAEKYFELKTYHLTSTKKGKNNANS